MKAISDYDLKKGTSIKEITDGYLDLKGSVDNLIQNMQNNPILAEEGIFEHKSIICKNLKGYFAYPFMGRMAPLAFSAVIEEMSR